MIALVGAVLLSSAVAFLAVPTTALADDALGLAGAPADAEGAVDGRTRFTYEIAPGQQVTDHYRVTNTGTTPQDVTVFASDAFNDPDGNYGLLPTDGEPTDAGSWVSLDGAGPRVSMSLQPGESRTVPFTLTVPADAGPGDHAGGIGISAVAADGQVRVDRRVASRLYVRVPGELQPILLVSGMDAEYLPSLNPLDGTTRVTYTVTNPGNVALSGTLASGVRTFFGIPVGAYTHDAIDELLPGSTRTLTLELHGIPPLIFLNPFLSLQPVADDPTLTAVQAVQTERDTVVIAIPWLILGVIVLVVGAILWTRFRRRRDERRAREWIEYTEAEARRKADHESELVGAGGSGS